MTTCTQYTVAVDSEANWTQQASDHTNIKGIVIWIELLCCKQTESGAVLLLSPPVRGKGDTPSPTDTVTADQYNYL